jgi:hypothetical protein
VFVATVSENTIDPAEIVPVANEETVRTLPDIDPVNLQSAVASVFVSIRRANKSDITTNHGLFGSTTRFGCAATTEIPVAIVAGIATVCETET